MLFVGVYITETLTYLYTRAISNPHLMSNTTKKQKSYGNCLLLTSVLFEDRKRGDYGGNKNGKEEKKRLFKKSLVRERGRKGGKK